MNSHPDSKSSNRLSHPRSGVNFINILLAHFLYKSASRSFFSSYISALAKARQHFCTNIASVTLMKLTAGQAKAARKTLVKSTHGVRKMEQKTL